MPDTEFEQHGLEGMVLEIVVGDERGAALVEPFIAPTDLPLLTDKEFIKELAEKAHAQDWPRG